MSQQQTEKWTAELKRIAGVLAVRSNDPAALADFTRLVKSMTPAARLDLVAVLQDMISAARKNPEFFMCVCGWKGAKHFDACPNCGEKRPAFFHEQPKFQVIHSTGGAL